MTAGDDGRDTRIAIVGMAALLPGAPDLETYWRNLISGTDAITEVPGGRWDPSYYPDPVYCRRGGFVDDLAEVEVTRFGIMPTSVAGTDPDQLIALAVAADAIADAGGEDRLPDRDRVGVVLGRGGYLNAGQVRLDQRLRTAHQLTRTLGELLPELGADQLARVREAFAARLGPERPEDAIGLVPNLAASRLANRLDLRGPAYTIDAACASSLIAVDQAVAKLLSGSCDVMLAGGVHHCHDITLWSVFSQMKALSPSQRIRPFHSGADGILIGEGTGIVVLKRLADAERDGDRVYAVIRGTGVAGDGRAGGLVSPDPGGQTRAVRQAWAAAGLDPREPGVLGLLEAHGTGTPAGDTAELTTLAEVFGPPGAPSDGEGPVIGSVKSMIGHTMPAAGAAGLIKAALAVHRATLLPTLHCDDPHPTLARTRFRPVATAQPWEGELRRAAVNAFGFGGINAHVVIEQAAPDPAPRRSRGRAVPGAVREPERVLRLAAGSPAELATLLDADDADLRALAGAAPAPDAPVGGRLGIVEPTAKRLALARRVVAKGRAWRGRDDVWFSATPLLAGPGAGRLAFVFPGLEAEFEPRGLDEVAERFGLPMPGRTEADAGDTARQGLGVIGIGRLLDAALRRMGVVPDAVAGHSVGEWTAMVAGGLHSREQSDEVLAAFDPDSFNVPGVVFAALGCSADKVTEAIAGRDDIVLSHDNSPRQSMVCGPREAVEELVRWFRERRVLGRVLPFMSGFHTPMLAPYLGPLAEGAERFELHAPTVPVWSATIAAPFPDEHAEVRRLFIRHLLEPVRFRPTVQAMYAAGFRAFIQVGTGQVGSLIDDTLDGQDHLTVSANSPHRGGLAQLRRVATALWTEGAAVDDTVLTPPRAKRETPVRPATRLTLGAPLISLEPGERDALGADLRGAVRGPSAVAAPELGSLNGLAARFPVAAELGALLAETATAAAAVIAARDPAAAVAAPPAPPAQAPAPASPPAAPFTMPLVVSTRTMPYLLDHCFFPQRPGWPDDSDRRPVVPATTLMRHMMDAAELAVPGTRAVAVYDVRCEQWADAIPEVTVDVTATPREDGRLAVAFGPYARAQVELAPDYAPDRPAPWPFDPAGEWLGEHTPEEIYGDRWLFHGPAFQGLTYPISLGEKHVRGVIAAPPAPGSLLDNVGQLIGYWLLTTQPGRNILFPIQMGRVRFFGSEPPPGTAVECHIRVTSVTETGLDMDAQLTVGGRVWAEITDWKDRRFAGPDARRTGGYPERRGLSVARPGGWYMMREQAPDLASRDLLMRTQLGHEEREEYARRPPRGRRQWLLGRIAAKDAVRNWLWERGEGAVFPAEIRIANDAAGRPYATGAHGRKLPALDLSLAHRGDVAVALVRPASGTGVGTDVGTGVGTASGTGVGIDVEEITADVERAVAVALGDEERALLEAVRAADGRSAAEWFTRFWAAKEAAAKAEGTGFRGRPRDFAVVAADADELTVAVGPRRHRVRCARVVDPANTDPNSADPVTTDPASGDGAKIYIVAWTAPNNEETSQ
ncbi:polyketide synthase [Streptomyces sp. NBC_01803]|uniref:polyketide synthase n=1 Tax=Streptomyces sp. NBC_01803 TaxID=2975946 RepID=UPI002DD9DB11|nr:polyketide synthase [Streptomyces sp. NBC_01803]WSA43577.1 acyltransferase domain-containing protein [Streptomyces sp. NBC_01803]